MQRIIKQSPRWPGCGVAWWGGIFIWGTLRPRKITRDRTRRGRLWLTDVSGRRRCVIAAHVVADAWLGPAPPGAEVCHINDRPWDNRPENLRYASHRENMADAVKNGRTARGERHPAALTTEAEVRRWLRAWERGDGVAKIAARAQVPASRVAGVAYGRTWKHLPRRPRRPAA